MLHKLINAPGDGLQFDPLVIRVTNRSGVPALQGQTMALDHQASATEATQAYPPEFDADLEQIGGWGSFIAPPAGGETACLVLLLEAIADNDDGEAMVWGYSDKILTSGSPAAGEALTTAATGRLAAAAAGNTVRCYADTAADSGGFVSGFFSGLFPLSVV